MGRVSRLLRNPFAARRGGPGASFDAAALLAECGLRAAPPDPAGAGVARRVWEMRPDLRAAFPLGLTPAGRRDYARWLLTHGAADFGLTPGGVLAYLAELAAGPSHGLGDSYLWQPDWQQAVPHGTTRAGWDELKQWLAQRYGVQGGWLAAARRPERFAEWDHTPDGPGVNLLAHWRFPGGLQEEAVQIAAGLEAAGFRVARRDVPVRFPCDCDDPGAFADPERYGVTLLTTGAGRGLDPQYPAAGLHPRPGVYRIAHWAWELDTLPQSYADRATLADEFWASSEFCATAIRKVVRGRPVVAMPPGVATPKPADLPRSHFGLPDDRFVVLFAFDMGSGMERKNPLGLIRAFRLAFARSDPADLVIKLSRGESQPANYTRLMAAADRAGVTVIDRVMSRGESFALMAACDCYASLHRSEGFGLTVAEAMLLGKPVVATDYSSTAEFLVPAVGLTVRHWMVPVGPGQDPYPAGAWWAEPDELHAADRLRWAFDHPAEARALGARARRHAEAVLSPGAAGRRMADRLRAVLARRTGAAA
jgi:glycosyltransferase involved in cell wall biosynthesis